MFGLYSMFAADESNLVSSAEMLSTWVRCLGCILCLLLSSSNLVSCLLPLEAVPLVSNVGTKQVRSSRDWDNSIVCLVNNVG